MAANRLTEAEPFVWQIMEQNPARVNEVANYARSLGYYAIAFHNGDGYYARVFAR